VIRCPLVSTQSSIAEICRTHQCLAHPWD
jgi:hypothetical protein